jgi:hypothetical protein
VANLKIEGIDDKLHKEMKKIAGEKKRLVRKQRRGTKSPGQVLLDLSGSWKDDRKPEEIIPEIKEAGRNRI